MAVYPRQPNRQPYPSDRYLKTDPLRREFGLRLLSEPLPEPLRTSLVRAWRRPARYDGKQAIQSLHRQRPDEASLSLLTPGLLDLISLTELEVARRVVETPRTSISRDMRNKLLKSQGSYLCALYRALAGRVGEAAALAAFERLVRRSSNRRAAGWACCWLACLFAAERCDTMSALRALPHIPPGPSPGGASLFDSLTPRRFSEEAH